MRFVVDEQLPPALAEWLRSKGHEAEHVRDCGLSGASDQDVHAYALARLAVIVSKDEDFLRIVRPDGARLLWIRLGNTLTRVLIGKLDAIWPSIEREFEGGAAVVEVR